MGLMQLPRLDRIISTAIIISGALLTLVWVGALLSLFLF